MTAPRVYLIIPATHVAAALAAGRVKSAVPRTSLNGQLALVKFDAGLASDVAVLTYLAERYAAFKAEQPEAAAAYLAALREVVPAAEDVSSALLTEAQARALVAGPAWETPPT